MLYVGNTTAPAVVQLACEVNLLGIRDENIKPTCDAPLQTSDDCP